MNCPVIPLALEEDIDRTHNMSSGRMSITQGNNFTLPMGNPHQLSLISLIVGNTFTGNQMDDNTQRTFQNNLDGIVPIYQGNEPYATMTLSEILTEALNIFDATELAMFDIDPGVNTHSTEYGNNGVRRLSQ
jgi:hypothetical protein